MSIVKEAYEFLGLPQSQWQFINSFADWFAAAGTIAAVWATVWLAMRATRPRLKFTVAVMITAGYGEIGPEFLMFRVVNTGDRPTQITGVGWRVGLPFFRRFAFQLLNSPPEGVAQSQMPIFLAQGEDASWSLDLQKVYRRETWAQDFAKKFLGRWPWLGLKTLRAQIYTSTGHIFVAKSASLSRLLGKARKSGVSDDGRPFAD